MSVEITPAEHRRVTELFLRALEVAAPAREAWLAELDREHPAHAADVRHLVEAHLHADQFLAVADEPPEQGPPATRAGEVVGPFVVEREIGHGGMGTVYLATRDGAGFSQRVALKLLAPHEGAAAAARVRDERRILAGLNHPNIAHFVDGGTTDGGLPFIAMEYVDGQSILDHCSKAALDVRGRLRLFLRVCGAVHFAHQHLVVHRDIKPSNILVTSDGTPKLLDFGIAKLLDAAGPAAAAGTLRVLTPHYASPEQVRGEAVTTATDIYSLGVLLFELLTGRGPYRDITPDSSPLVVMEAIRDATPERPGAVAAAGHPFGRDLDAIVLRALRKDPRERYASAEHLAQDVTRYLDGLPVDARRGTTMYRVQRFATRHTFGVAAAAALALALVGGGATTAWQARVAQAERDKAQNRFRQIEEFSRSLLFDVHAALRDVPGATNARRLLLDRAVAFLDGLAADAGDDRALMRVLAAGYQRLAAVQGLGLTQNVGDEAGALASLDKAAGYVDRLRVDEPTDGSLLTLGIGIHFARAAAMGSLERPEAVAEAAVHAALIDELERLAPPGSIVDVARGHADIGRMQADAGDFAAAEREYRRAVDLFAGLPDRDRTAQAISANATALKRLGAVLMRRQAYAESEQRYLQALALDEAGIRLDDRPQTRFDITFTMSDLALVRGLTNRLAEAEELWHRALTIREAAWAADPKDVRALNGVAVLYGRLGGAAYARHDWLAAVRAYQTEVERREALVALTGRLPARVADLSWARLRLAEALADQAEAAPRAAGVSAGLGLARRLVAATTRSDGKVPVPAGSEPDYVVLYDTLRRRLDVR